MQTLYIDVYFLINFTVDTIALYFAARAGKFRLSRRKICLCGGIGAAAACGCLFLPEPLGWLSFPILLLSVGVACLICGRGARPVRVLRFALWFALFETLFGGCVYFLYGLLEREVLPRISDADGGAKDRRFLFLALLILLSYGGVKLAAGLLSGHRSTETLRLSVTLCGNTLECEGLVDSGNLLRDPADRSPVILIKEKEFRPILPPGVDFSEPGADLPDPWRRRVRLIPIRRGDETIIRIGFMPDKVTICDRPREALAVTLAVDPEEGSYGGYGALIPAAALDE